MAHIGTVCFSVKYRSVKYGKPCFVLIYQRFSAFLYVLYIVLYIKILTYKWWAGKDLNLQCPGEPDLQSGAIPITLYRPMWHSQPDSNRIISTVKGWRPDLLVDGSILMITLFLQRTHASKCVDCAIANTRVRCKNAKLSCTHRELCRSQRCHPDRRRTWRPE